MSDLHLPAGVSENYSNLNEKHNTSKVNVTALVDEDNFLCCHWSDTHINCFVYTAKMETKAFTYSESSALTSQKTGMLENGGVKGSQNHRQWKLNLRDRGHVSS